MIKNGVPTKVYKKGSKAETDALAEAAAAKHEAEHATLIIQFRTENGEATASPLEIPKDITVEQLTTLVNSLLENEEKTPYSFFLNDDEILSSLQDVVNKQKSSIEQVLDIMYRPQALFRVNSVARCTSSLPGHTEAILHVGFSADGKHLASAGGDATVRIWDVNTETPKHTFKGHEDWVLAVSWSPLGDRLASGGKDCQVRVWDPITCKLVGKVMRGHTHPVTSLAWEPVIAGNGSKLLASGSKDGTVRIWDTVRSICVFTLSGHTKAIDALKWGGQGLLYTGSQDRTIRVWDVATGRLYRVLEGHAHWVNSLSLNTEYALRTGPYDHNGRAPSESKDIIEASKTKYDKAAQPAGGNEYLVSCSDDFTLMLWNPKHAAKPVHRMTGHQQPINQVAYSPDGTMIASASFDKSVRLWNGITGAFLAVFRGHVQQVYHVAWSADSRWIVSGSKDSTIKLWSIPKRKMIEDLPGHADEVYAVDWSPDGQRVASGGKDKLLKIWRA